MLPFRKILFPTDFSDPSFYALNAARELAVNWDADLILVHVVSPIPIVSHPGSLQGVDTAEYLEKMLVYARESMDRLVVETLPDTIRVRMLVLTGSPGDEIVRAAEEQAADLVVIATHGVSGWRRFIFGSVAERVVRQSPCPVLSVPAPQEEKSSRR